MNMTLSEYLASPKGAVYTHLFSKVGLDLASALGSATKSAVSVAPDAVNFDDYTSGFFIAFAKGIPIGDRLQFIDSMTKTHSVADMRGLFAVLPEAQQRELIATEAAIIKAVNRALESDPPNMSHIDAFVKSVNVIPVGKQTDFVFASGGSQDTQAGARLGLVAQAAIGASVMLSLVLLFKSTRD